MERMKKIGKVIGLIAMGVVVWVGIIIAIVVADESDTTSESQTIERIQLPGNAGVYRDIAGESDCGELQATFDRAMDNFERGVNKEIVMSYAEAAHSRMKAICY